MSPSKEEISLMIVQAEERERRRASRERQPTKTELLELLDKQEKEEWSILKIKIFAALYLSVFVIGGLLLIYFAPHQ